MPLAIMLQVLSLLASAPHPSLYSRSSLRLPILKKKRKKPQIQQKSDVVTPITLVTEKDFRDQESSL